MQNHPSLQQLHLTLGRSISSQFLWNFATKFKWQGMEFADVRWYVAGDPIKRIDWKTSAKKWGDLYIKEFVEERQLKVWMVSDVLGIPSPQPSPNRFARRESACKLDKAKEVMYALGYAAIRNGDKIGLIDWSQTVKMWGKWETLWTILEGKRKKEMGKRRWEMVKYALWWVSVGRQELSLENKLQQIIQMKESGTLVVIVTDRIDLDHKLIKQVGSKNEILRVHLFSAQELALRSDVEYIRFGSGVVAAVETPCRASVHWQVTGVYENAVDESLQEMRRLVQWVWGRYVRIHTEDDVVRELMKVM